MACYHHPHSCKTVHSIGARKIEYKGSLIESSFPSVAHLTERVQWGQRDQVLIFSVVSNKRCLK